MREKSGKRNLLLAVTIVGLGLSASMNPACADDLWDAINTAASAGLYTLNSDYTLPDGKSSLGDLKVGVFVLEGNNKSIELNKKSGVSIGSDKSMTIRNAIIKNALNSAEGGAIYNEGKLEITGSQFNDDHADDDDAGAIWNEGTISKILADFNNNGATDNGGAIYNKGTITTVSGNFIGNRAEDDGGAIYNKGTISSISGRFQRNTSGDDGGAICNKSDATINEINATFWGNQLKNDQGGAIYNDGTIGTIKGSFEHNWVLDSNLDPKREDVASYHNRGGALYNDGKITSIDADFTNNTVMGQFSRGGAIYNEGTIGSIHGNFKGNVDLMRSGVDSYVVYGGGAIYNDDDGRIGSITGTFTENEGQSKKQFYVDNDGGAILNAGNITSINADFYRNSTIVNGGAIFNHVDGHIGSITGTFEGNTATPEEYGGYWSEHAAYGRELGGKGGAIYNYGKIDSITGKFINNEATFFTGGAIQNHARETGSYGTIKYIHADFIGNRARYAGGAIAIDHRGYESTKPTIETIEGNFINNWVHGTWQPYKDQDPWKAKGGAIWSRWGTINKISASFNGNSSEGQGGAIWHEAHDLYPKPVTISGSFKNNYAYDKGGAIYLDDGDIIITTEDNTDTIFSGNKQNVTGVYRDRDNNITNVVGGESNAIYNNDYVEFSPKEGRTIWMYDKIADTGDNAGWEWVKTGKGTLALGHNMTGITGDVWIKEGTIKLVQNDSDPSIYGTAFSMADDVTYENNVYIDSQNNHIDNFHLGKDVTLEGTLHSLIDVALANQTGDKIIAGDDISGSGSIVIDSIKIITGGGTYDESTKNILIADDYTKGKISLGSNIKLTGEGFKNWVLSYIPTSGILNFQRGLSLKEVTNATEPESRVFNAPDDEIVNDNIGNIGHGNATLVVNMNNYAINGKKDDTYHSGFVTTAGDQILTVNDAEVINFKGSNGSFIYDDYGAEINVNNSTIKNNEATDGGIIYSRGNLLTLTDSNFMDNKISGLGGAIYSKGDVTVNAINNEVQFAGNYKEVGGDIITANAIYMEGTEENPITLTLNSKDSTHAVSIGDKVDGSYYNIVINDTEDSLGNILFGNSVNTGSLTLNKGVLENNGTITATSGTNNGTITYDSTLGLKGDFILDDKGSTLVFNNNGSFTQNSLTIKSGEFKTDSSNLHISSDIVNDGTLVFNNTTNGSINQNIKGSTSSSDGIVEIAASDKVTVDLNGYTITNNNVKLTSGILDVTKSADTDGNIDISSMGLVANGGTLNLQDNKAGEINLGDIKTGTGDDAKNLNVAIDMHFVTDTVDPDILNEYADIISVNSLTGDGKIHVNDIKMSKNEETGPVTPSETTMSVEVARGAAAIANMDFTGTTITNIDKTFSSVMLTYDSGWLTVSSTTPTLEKAVTSYVSTKLYAMGVDGTGAGIDENIDNLVLNGVHLAVTTNGADILSTSGDNSTDGIHIADGEETLTLYGKLDSSGNPETKISGFKTAIDNLAGGEVHLENIEMSGNTTDVLNAGKLNLDGKNIINTIADNTTEPMGSTNIVGGTSTIGSIVQKAVNILPDAELNIDADKLSAKDGVDNWGRLNLGDGDLASNIFESQQDTKQGVTNIVGDVKNTSDKTIAQKSVTIANSAILTTDADKVTADDGISNEGTLNLTGGELASSVNGTGTTNIKGDVTNLSRNIISQKSIAIDSTSSLTSLAGKLIAEDGITNAGTLNLTNGKLASSVSGTGTTNIETYVETNGNNITQSTVNVGQNGTEEAGGYLLNDAIINATNINVTTEGEFGNIGTISATTIANAGNVYIEEGSVNVSSITTDANASTIINGGNVNADNITNNGETNITGGTVVADIIENTGGGTTTIAGGDVVANTSITNSGTGDTDIYSVVKTPLVSATNGDINIYATNGQTATSNLLKDAAGTGLAEVTTSAGGTVSVNTNSRALVIDNNVSGTGTLNLNGGAGSEFYVGSNAAISSALNIASGQLNAGDGSNITGPISVAADAILSTMNDDYSTFNNITFADGSNLKVDVNAISNQTDKFVSPVEPVGGSIFLKDLSIQDISQIGTKGTSINLSQSIGLNKLQSSDDLRANLNAKYGLTPIRRRNINVQTTPEGLMLNIAGMGNKYKDFNPAVMASPVAAQMGGYLTQLQSYDEAFHNMDMYMLMTAQQRQALKYKNKIASLDGGVLYDKTLMRQERAEGWFRPYATFEKVGLKNGPKVENQAYGSFVGGESQMYDLGHGWDGMWGAYVGYNGSHQHYDGINIYQNGGTLGLTGMAYKGNFFTGLTINAGASAAEASTMYGHEDLTMLMAGIASKTGYNWELANGKFIIQPSWLMSYSFVNTFDYTNAAGVRMHSSPLNAIQLQPELKFIGNLKNGWQPYASVAMVWNIMDDTKFKANDVTLPELSVKPYVKYGVGLRKIWGERFTGFFQTYLTNGGRNGVGLQAGFTWALGGGKDKKAAEHKIQKSLKRAPELKKTEIVLNGSKT